MSKSPPKRKFATLLLVLLLAAGIFAFQFWRGSPVRRSLDEGRVSLAQGNGAAAVVSWHEVLRLDPKNTEALQLLGDYQSSSENWPQARLFYGQLVKSDPQSARAWGRLAVAAAHLNETETVKQASSKALSLDPNNDDALALKVTLLGRDMKWVEQADALRRLRQIHPKNLQFIAQHADVLTTLKRFDEARPLLEELIKAQPELASAYAMRAEGKMGDHATPEQLAQAARDLRKSLALDPSQEKARLLLAQLYSRQSNFSQSIAQYREILTRWPARTMYFHNLAEVYLKAGDKAGALKLRQRIALLNAQHDKKSLLESRVANNPRDFENTLALGLLLLRSPEPLKADHYIEAAAKLRPADKLAQSAVRELEQRYQEKLRAGLKAMKAANIKKADHEISRALMLRPRDPRSLQAVELLKRAAAGTP